MNMKILPTNQIYLRFSLYSLLNCSTFLRLCCLNPANIIRTPRNSIRFSVYLEKLSWLYTSLILGYYFTLAVEAVFCLLVFFPLFLMWGSEIFREKRHVCFHKAQFSASVHYHIMRLFLLYFCFEKKLL